MTAIQTRIIAVVAAAVLIIGGGVYVLHSRNSSSSNPNQTSSTPTASASPQANSGGQTLGELLAMGGNKKCTFSVNGTSGGSTSGTIYVANANTRGDFTIKTSDGKSENDHIIRIGDENYIWGGSFPSGVKMKMSVSQLSQNSQASNTINVNQKTNFNCTNSSVDSSMFTVPANISFTDMSSLVAPSAMPGGSMAPNSNAAECAACNSLSGNSKTACLSSLHCQ